MPSRKAESFEYKEIPLDGRLITAVDATRIGANFQALQNMRYTDSAPQAIGGMTKINTTAITTYLKVRNGFHFVKNFPAVESHVLVQAYNSGETVSQVLQNTTAIPDQGDFLGTALHTDASGAGRGVFSGAPDGMIAYCNSKETMLWGGDELRCAGFINYDPDGTFKYDYTDVVNNILDDAQNVATLAVTSEGIDSNTLLLLHLNDNVTDVSPTTPHTVTNNNVTFDASTKVFGSHSAVFNGSTAYLTAPDDADFDFSGGIFTIDYRGQVDSLASDSTIFYQETNATNYIVGHIETDGSIHLHIQSGGSDIIDVHTPVSTIVINTFYHIEFVENGNDYYIFVDGVQKGYVSDTDRAADYTGVFQIGYNGSKYYDGYIDEFRVSNVARHTSGFEIPLAEYSTSVTTPYLYIGSTQPLRGIKFYIKTANTATGTLSAYYWDGAVWAPVSTLVDGTASGGISMAQTGSITFDDTENLAKIKLIDQISLYWYKISITSADSSTSISQCSGDASFQSIKDIWDGAVRSVFSFQIFDNDTFNDNTINVFDIDFNSVNTATFAELDSLGTASDYVVVGFSEKMMGLDCTIVGGSGNQRSGTELTVSYWNGTAWVSVGTIEDGTIETSVSFAKSGIISWNPVDKNTEFKREISSEFPLHYYKLSFSEDLSGDVKLDFIGGITAPKDIAAYKFPMFAHDRVFLCSNQDGAKNTALVSATNTAVVFNGDDSLELSFGDVRELTAAVGMFRQYGSSLYNLTVFTKSDETWVLVGNGPEDWVKYQASDEIGCVAPLTVKVAHVSYEVAPGQNRYVAIWQGADGIYLFDGAVIRPIHEDIKDIFDKRLSTSINPDKLNDSVGFFDRFNQEYHFLYAEGSSTTLNKERVYDLKRQRWYGIVRGSGKELQIGFKVTDTDNNNYVYGSIDTGFIERTENGTDFDGTAIACILDVGDVPLSEGLSTEETQIRTIKLTQVAKNITSNSVTLTHYGDTDTAGAVITYPVSAATKRVVVKGKSTDLGPFTFHRIKLELSTDDETIGFEPLALAVAYRVIRQTLN